MAQPNYLPEVRNQYENYPYPPVNPEHDKKRLYMPMHEAFDTLNYSCFSGRRDFRKPFRALVAGGGTGDATMALAEQLRDYPESEVVYLDMSQASMEVAQARARIRGLTNIKWVRDSMLNIPKLALGEFDYINSSGVLHHLSDPDAGLKVLSDALAEDGAMGIMVYAKYGRTGVYMMQDTLRLLNQGEPDMEQRVKNTRTLLDKMPASNWFPQSPKDIITELVTDAGLYDLLLHSQDRSYSVPEMYGFIEGAGLQILRFLSEDRRMGNNMYNPALYLYNPDLQKRAAALPLRDQQALSELLNGKIIRHMVYAAKNERPLPSLDDLDNIPVIGMSISSAYDYICQVLKDAPVNETVNLVQENLGISLYLPRTPHIDGIFRHIDGKSSLRQIFRKVMDGNAHKKQKPDYSELTFEFNLMFSVLNNFNWMFLRGPDTARVLSLSELQSRVKA